MALTLDMGGRVDPAVQIMEWMVANRIKSTIFMTGAMVDNVNTDAGRRVLEIVDQNRDLFELSNHSYTHPDFRDLTAAQMANELRRTEETFAKYTNLSARPMWRPPYGGWNNAVLAAVGPAGYPYTIMWDIDTIDWRPESEGGPTTQFMINKVVNNAQGGSIVLMHLGGWNTLDALPGMVAGLRAKGFEFAKVSEMLPR
ncbi:MAG TPA: polysaccharide deacetylase family protein [Planctomycetaceae bacterium]|nr:polysaccharide deacetylase family protein [Planctomycetaceae bacterium]